MSDPVTIRKVYCDFCGKMQDFVRTLVAGPRAHICKALLPLAYPRVGAG